MISSHFTGDIQARDPEGFAARKAAASKVVLPVDGDHVFG
jgi:hypothetical protein